MSVKAAHYVTNRKATPDYCSFAITSVPLEYVLHVIFMDPATDNLYKLHTLCVAMCFYTKIQGERYRSVKNAVDVNTPRIEQIQMQ